MKRVLLVSALFSALVIGTVACDDDVNTLSNGSGAEDRQFAEDKDSTETPPSSKKSDTPSEPVKTPAKDAGSSKPPANNPSDCSATTTRNDCLKCCGVQNNPVTACGCDATTVCRDKCKDNLCSGETPSFECGLCMLQQGCGAQGNDDNAAPEDSEAAQCLQMCADKN